jgi:broad specificity phosphatase PhoE
VFLVRHGRTALNAAGQLRGHLDPSLDEVGRVEAYEVADALACARPVRILSSPLARAVQTVELLSSRTRIPVEVDERLIDRDYGELAGKSLVDVETEWGVVDDAPGVEPRQTVLERVRACLDDQIRYVGTGPVVLVSHDVAIRLLLSSIDESLGKPDDIAQRTGCWNVLERVESTWRVERVNQRS